MFYSIKLFNNMVYLDKILHLIHFNIDTDMLNGDEASPSISLAGFYHLVKMLMWKTDIFVIKTAYCIILWK